MNREHIKEQAGNAIESLQEIEQELSATQGMEYAIGRMQQARTAVESLAAYIESGQVDQQAIEAAIHRSRLAGGASYPKLRPFWPWRRS